MKEYFNTDAVQPEPALSPRPQVVPTNILRPNPHNPRKLFDRGPLRTLRESIRKVGVLVPLTVYKAAASDMFTILDGQRRWICSKNIGLIEIPVNVVLEPTPFQNIVTMFQIHNLRNDWELMPTALKLSILMDELAEQGDKALSELTGLDCAVVKRCKKLLSYEAKYQERMLDPNPEIRLDADLFIEMHPIITDQTVRGADWYNKTKIIDVLIDKYINKLSGFRSVTDFRRIKAALTHARRSNLEKDINARLCEFIERNDMEISELEIGVARFRREADGLSKSLKQLSDQVEKIDPDSFEAEEHLWVALEDLVAKIKEKSTAAGRRPV